MLTRIPDLYPQLPLKTIMLQNGSNFFFSWNEEKISKTLIYLNFLPYFSIFSRAREIQYCTTKIFYKIIYSIDQKNSFELLCNCRKCLHTFIYVLKFKIASTIDQKPIGFCTSAKIYVYVDSIQLHCKKNQLSMITLYNYIFSKKTLNMYLGT